MPTESTADHAGTHPPGWGSASSTPTKRSVSAELSGSSPQRLKASGASATGLDLKEPYDHGRLDVGDGNLVYWETCGNPDGKPTVVLHGGPGAGCGPGWRR